MKKLKAIILESKDLLVFFKKTDKLYLVPFVLLLVIIALLVISASISPIPVFLYPII